MLLAWSEDRVMGNPLRNLVGLTVLLAGAAGCGGNPFGGDKPAAKPQPGGGQQVARNDQPAAPAPSQPAPTAPPAAAVEQPWTPLGSTHRIQGIEVRIVEAKIEPLPTAPGDESEAPAAALVVKLRIDNKALAREVPFEGWYRQVSPPPAKLVDDRQKNYAMIPFPGQLVAGDPRLKPEGRTMHDLVFEVPDPAARTLFLELPGQRLGLSEPFRFEIPVAQLRRPAASKPGTPAPGEADKNEEAAARKLKLARQLADQGKPEDAREYLQDIVKKWPDTPSGKEAKKLLEKLKK